MNQIRSKLTYANVMATIAAFLVLAGGTAFAATQMLPKNSVGPKQIKKGAVTPAKLSPASKSALIGPPGATGATGASGPTGPQGPEGNPGEPGTLLETLPAGKTERGVYGLAGTRGTKVGSYFPGSSISFAVPLATSPTSHVIGPGGSSSECPGTSTNPKAAPGNLCLYQVEESAQLVVQSIAGGFKSGFFYLIHPAEGVNYEDYGVWAVTAG